MAAYEIAAAVLILAGAVLVLLSAVSMVRAQDALQMMNVFSPATGMGLPLVVIGVFVHLTGLNGLDGWTLLVALVTICALVVVSSLASNTLARAAYQSGAPLDPATHPQDLAARDRAARDQTARDRDAPDRDAPAGPEGDGGR
jgi:multicomponent Na+:H+ antiporter subunit G